MMWTSLPTKPPSLLFLLWLLQPCSSQKPDSMTPQPDKHSCCSCHRANINKFYHNHQSYPVIPVITNSKQGQFLWPAVFSSSLAAIVPCFFLTLTDGLQQACEVQFQGHRGELAPSCVQYECCMKAGLSSRHGIPRQTRWYMPLVPRLRKLRQRNDLRPTWATKWDTSHLKKPKPNKNRNVKWPMYAIVIFLNHSLKN